MYPCAVYVPATCKRHEQCCRFLQTGPVPGPDPDLSYAEPLQSPYHLRPTQPSPTQRLLVVAGLHSAPMAGFASAIYRAAGSAESAAIPGLAPAAASSMHTDAESAYAAAAAAAAAAAMGGVAAAHNLTGMEISQLDACVQWLAMPVRSVTGH